MLSTARKCALSNTGVFPTGGARLESVHRKVNTQKCPLFVHDDKRTVTNINIRTVDVRLLSRKLNRFQTEVLSLVEAKMIEEGHEKASTAWEIFLGKDSTGDVPSYYVIDHIARTLCSLEVGDTRESKEGQVKTQQLQELEYWRHMALYPQSGIEGNRR